MALMIEYTYQDGPSRARHPLTLADMSSDDLAVLQSLIDQYLIDIASQMRLDLSSLSGHVDVSLLDNMRRMVHFTLKREQKILGTSAFIFFIDDHDPDTLWGGQKHSLSLIVGGHHPGHLPSLSLLKVAGALGVSGLLSYGLNHGLMCRFPGLEWGYAGITWLHLSSFILFSWIFLKTIEHISARSENFIPMRDTVLTMAPPSTTAPA